MSRVVVIGATGHIGSYLVPRLVRGGHEVIVMSRGTREPYHASPQWNSVTFRSITASIDRARVVLGYAPRYSSLDALHEALAWLVARGQVDVGGQQFAPRVWFPQSRRGDAWRRAHRSSMTRGRFRGGNRPLRLPALDCGQRRQRPAERTADVTLPVARLGR